MTDPKDTQTPVNDSETSGSIDAGLTQDRSGFDLDATRRSLIAMRVKHGAESPIGHRCSNLIEQLQNLETATGDQRANLQKAIAQQLAGLGAQ